AWAAAVAEEYLMPCLEEVACKSLSDFTSTESSNSHDLLRTDSASLTVFRQRIAEYSSPPADSASITLGGSASARAAPEQALQLLPWCKTTPAGNRWRPPRGGSHERRTRGSSSSHYPAPRRPTRPGHLRRRRPLQVLAPQVVGPLPAGRPPGPVRPDAGQPPRRPAHPARAGAGH